MRDYSTNGTAKGDRSHFAKPIGGFYRNGAGLSSDDASETAGRDFRFVVFDKKKWPMLQLQAIGTKVYP